MRQRILHLIALGAVGLVAAPALAQGTPAGALAAKARDEVAAGQIDAAIADARRALDGDSGNLSAYEVLAAAYTRTGDFAAEAKTFAQAVTVVPGYANGWFHLAYALRQSGRLDDAAGCYRRAADLAPNEPDPWFGLALTYKALGNPAAALKAYERYVVLEKRPAQARWVDKAKVEMDALRASGAKGSPDSGATPPVLPVAAASGPPAGLTSSTTVAPAASAAPPVVPAAAQAAAAGGADAQAARFKLLGDTALAAKHVPEALRDYRAALAANPKYTDAHVGLAQVYIEQERYPAAIAELQGALAADPVYARAWELLSGAQLAAGDPAEALRCGRRATALLPKDPDAWLGMARAAESAGDRRSAAAAYGRYVEIENRPERAADLAQARAALAKIEPGAGGKAEEAAATAVAPPPAAAESTAARSATPGTPARTAARAPAAPAPLASSVAATSPAAPPGAPFGAQARPPRTVEAAISDGNVAFAAGRFAEAAVAYREAADAGEAAPAEKAAATRPVGARYREGVALAASGDLWGAVGAWERVLQADPGFAPARLNLVRARARLARAPSTSPAARAVQLAGDQLASGDVASSRAVLDRALAERPDDATALELRGRAKAELLDDAGAAGDFLRALALDPGRPSLYRELAETCARRGDRPRMGYFLDLYRSAAAGDREEAARAEVEEARIRAVAGSIKVAPSPAPDAEAPLERPSFGSEASFEPPAPKRR